MSIRLDRLANQLDWNLLRTFMVIVQERSITGASQRLNVTQPSVSAALRRLEERLGHRLIERGSGQGFAITRAGEAVYREAVEIYGGVLRLNDLAAHAEKAITGNLVLHRSNHLDTGFLNELLSDFRRRYPGVTYAIRSSPCFEVNQALLQRVSSIGFCTRVEPSPRLQPKALKPLEFGFFCGPNSSLFGVGHPDAEALARADVVGFEEDHIAGALSPVTVYRVRNGIGDQIVAVTTGIVDLLNMIRNGDVVGAVPISLARDYGSDLWQIPLEEASPHVDVFAVIDADRHLTPAENAFLEHLVENGIVAQPSRRSEV
jgi:DNA-binding transcriptional LysR family regulator